MPATLAHAAVRVLAALLAMGLPVDAGARQAPVGEACTKTVRWELQPPYGVVDSDGGRSGYYIAVVEAALERLGCTAVIREMPWARGLKELEAGRLDLMPGMLANRDRRRFAYFSFAINLSPNLLFLNADAALRHPLPGLAALRDTDLRIAVETGAYYSEEYASLMEDARFVARLHFVPERERAWRMLATGRIDGLVSDQARALAAGIPLQPGASDVRPVLVLSSEPARVAFSRRSVDAAFVRRFDEALSTLRADGTLVRLRERYVPCVADPDTLGCAVVPEGPLNAPAVRTP